MAVALDLSSQNGLTGVDILFVFVTSIDNGPNAK